MCPKSGLPAKLESLVPDMTMSDLSEFMIDFNNIVFEEKIGEGAFGNVYKGMLRLVGWLISWLGWLISWLVG